MIAADVVQRHRTGGPVFVYSGFRASSTWFWAKFRADPGLLCYYEPFNEQLANLTAQNIGEARPETWRSHHPAGAPYVLEYAGLLDGEEGVRGFPAHAGEGERYLDRDSAGAVLDPDVLSYVQGLVAHAGESGRLALLSCTRMLGRAAGLRKAFAGYHILLIRNLFQQWNSHAGQARFGNWYFLQEVFKTMDLGKRDPFVRFLRDMFPPEDRESLERWVAPDSFDKVFCYFVGFHLYFLTLARRSCDLVVDVGALATDEDYRESVTTAINGSIGVALDLTDARERIDFPLRPVGDAADCRRRIDRIVARLETTVALEREEKAFVDGIVADLWREHALFMRAGAGAFEHLAVLEKQAGAAEQEIDRLRAVNAQLVAEVRQLRKPRARPKAPAKGAGSN